MRPKPDRPTPPFKITPLVVHVLLSLADGEAHAYGIMKDITRRTRSRLRVGPGSLHFTLSKLLAADLIREARGSDAPDAGVRRKRYRLTPFGRAILRAEVEALEEIVALARAKRLAPRR